MAVRAMVRQVVHESCSPFFVQGCRTPSCLSAHPLFIGPSSFYTFNCGYRSDFMQVPRSTEPLEIYDEDHIEVNNLTSSRTGGSQVAAFDATARRDGNLGRNLFCQG